MYKLYSKIITWTYIYTKHHKQHNQPLFQPITISRRKDHIIQQYIPRNRGILRITKRNNIQDIRLPLRHISPRDLGPLLDSKQLRRSNTAHRRVPPHVHIHGAVLATGPRDLRLHAEFVFSVSFQAVQALGYGVAAVSYCRLEVAGWFLVSWVPLFFSALCLK
jgi:hypothetical protein